MTGSTKPFSYLMASLGVAMVVCGAGRSLSAAELTGCWVGWVSGESTTYLTFDDNSKCRFNKTLNNCRVTYPLDDDPNHYDIKLEWPDKGRTLLGNVNFNDMQGNDFYFSRGTTCPLPEDAQAASGTRSSDFSELGSIEGDVKRKHSL